MKLALTTLLTLTALASTDDGPFRSLEFEAALVAAKTEGKVVMVDFFTTWCAPCKKLDSITWKDESVVAWLAEKTVALKIDAEKDIALAKRYSVESYPTLLFVRPDGTEIDRLIGYRAPTAFLREAADALRGRSSIDRARDALIGKEKDPLLRMDLAKALAQKGNREEALAEYMWCFDHGVEHDPAFYGVRGSFLLNDIMMLSRKYPPARKALEQRRDLARKSVLEKEESNHLLRDLVLLNEKLGQKGETLILHDELKGLEGRRETLRVLVESITDLLVKERRYTDVITGSENLSDWFDSQLHHVEMLSEASGNLEGIGKVVSSRFLMKAGRYYEALLGAEPQSESQQPSAIAFEGRILDHDSTGATFVRLIKHAIRAEAFDRARILVAAAKSKLTDEKELKRVQRAARKIPKLSEGGEDWPK